MQLVDSPSDFRAIWTSTAKWQVYTSDDKWEWDSDSHLVILLKYDLWGLESLWSKMKQKLIFPWPPLGKKNRNICKDPGNFASNSNFEEDQRTSTPHGPPRNNGKSPNFPGALDAPWLDLDGPTWLYVYCRKDDIPLQIKRLVGTQVSECICFNIVGTC